MKSISNITVVMALAACAGVSITEAFQPPHHHQSKKCSSSTRLYEYVPSGFTPAQYKKFKADEAKKAKAKKNLGGLGPRGFQSRSMQSFQEAMEKGEASHLMPVFNAKERVKRGELKVEDIPYMQRGGNWDNTDVKGAKKKNWLKSDKEYSAGGFRKEQSVSIFGQGAGLDWTGQRGRSGPSESVLGAAPKFGKNYKAPNVSSFKTTGKKAGSVKANANKNGKDEPPKKKKMFGFF
mmetsp:Transcript_26832/g.58862  ORF Transcript_26832/g.58862 Transcript_26832/m.58862 type:complete len:236 (+) Transcript_26832:145-852(+)|eukprot:CAMPEP_0168182454 /NCGR_PEP_ID=MMETSP0139_2-20121125/11903_1 /TAXON_ID=44445 /ORGANISM="Pseudo-nitzschia australis, Strain 10249 10 AB" /LENGTH=235 /DNA_ID=CAMNT_0008103387 /DNA_START=75 /DNA_END=782 /DNA_ORIENTATION=+